MWLKGDSAQEAAAVVQRSSNNKEQSGLWVNYARSQYRTFELLEPFLQHPTGIREEDNTIVDLLANQEVVPLPAHVQSTVIEMYYEFDDAVLRELLGKKLSSRLRKDLEDIAAETGVPLASCRRQFDNMKRVYKITEELMGDIVSNIQQHVLVSNGLASKYARVIFISKNRLEISAHKKRLTNLSFQDIEYCAGAFMQFWCTEDQGEPTADMDPAFLRDIADLKSKGTKKKENGKVYFNSTFFSFGLGVGRANRRVPRPCPARDRRRVHRGQKQEQFPRHRAKPHDDWCGSSSREGAARCFQRHGTSQLGRVLSHGIAQIEKIVEPCQKAHWTTKDMDLFLQAVRDKFGSLTFLDPSARDRLVSANTRFLKAMHMCMMRLFPKITLQ